MFTLYQYILTGINLITTVDSKFGTIRSMETSLNDKSVITIDKLYHGIIDAEQRIRPYIRTTPLEYSPFLSRIGNCSVYLKLENLQVTSAFKIRGAANKLLSIPESLKKNGIITASSGNHGIACAHMLQTLGITGTIFLPENVSKAKLDSLNEYNAEIKMKGQDCIETEIRARKMAEESNRVYISPYNDPEIIHGQGTGTLRQVVREQLAKHPLVKSYRPGDYGEGGAGVTVAELIQK